MRTLIVPSLIVWVLMSSPLSAVVRNVPSEYASIQAAIDACQHGDTVLVAPGLYYGQVNFNGKNIIVTSTDPNNPAVVGYTILNAEGQGPVVTFENGESSSATLAGFTLTGGVGQLMSYSSDDYKYYYGAGIYCAWGSPTITRNVIVNNVSPYSREEVTEQIGNTTYMYYRYEYSYGGGIYYAGFGAITHNKIYNNSAYSGGGILVEGSATVSNNLIYNNSAVYGGGVRIYMGSLTNNTIVGNNTNLEPESGYAGNVYAYFPDDYTYLTIANNIIASAGSGGGLYWRYAGGDAIRYNDVWGNTPGDYVTYDDTTSERIFGGQADWTGLCGNISEDPIFITSWNRRYHLDAESPCISAGDPNFAPLPGETDIDGDPRIYALIVDIGADEYIGYVKPLASAGPDQHILVPEPVVLDGTGSYFSDPAGVKTFQWSQVSGPEVALSDPTAASPSFTPPSEGWYKFELTVSDGQYTSNPDTMLLVVGNERPVADAGPDALWPAPGFVHLDGSGSSDADPPDTLTYTWTQLEGPPVELSDPGSAQPYFISEKVGVFVFQLVVNDGFVESQPDEVKIEMTFVTLDVEPFVATELRPPDYAYYFYPAVSGTSLAYVGGDYTPSYWQVHWIDSKTGATQTFDAGSIDTKPRIDGDLIVWAGGSGYYYEPVRTSVYVADLKTGARSTLHAATGTESYGYPVIAGNIVVYLRHRQVNTNDYDGYFERPFDICGADLTDLANPVYFTIVADAGTGLPYPADDPWQEADSPVDIWGTTVVWENNGDIFGADISDLNDIRIFPICTAPKRQFDPAVSGDLVVWRDQRNDSGDIYAADISDRANVREFEVQVERGTALWPDIDGPIIVYVEGGEYGGYVRAACVTRQYGVMHMLLPNYPYAYDSGIAIDGSTITWSDWDWQIVGVRLDFSYAVVDGPIRNATTGRRYDYIQHAITAAADGDVIMLDEGTYWEKLRFGGKNITLTSTDPRDPAVRAATVLTGSGPLVSFADGESADCTLTGFTIAGGTFGVFCNGSSPTVTDCDITGQAGAGVKLWAGCQPAFRRCQITANGIGVEMWADTSARRVTRNEPLLANCIVAGNRAEGILGDSPTVANCTIADNLGYGLYCARSNLMNSIVYFNNAGGDNLVSRLGQTVTHCDIQGGTAGEGNINADPCFAARGLWGDPDGGGAWTMGDYHLKSQGWRWDPVQAAWVWDDVTSPCIDAGDPRLPLGDESPCQPGDPLSERAENAAINMGAYGGTAEASLAPRG